MCRPCAIFRTPVVGLAVAPVGDCVGECVGGNVSPRFVGVIVGLVEGFFGWACSDEQRVEYQDSEEAIKAFVRLRLPC